jgi:hypothetical protein
LFKYNDETKYFGEWEKDVRRGIGTYSYSNGDKYEG